MNSFTPEQMQQLRSVFREELADAGLRLDGEVHQDEAREDFRFLRRLRRNADNVSSKVGMTVLMAVAGGLIWVFVQGANIWKNSVG